MKLLIAIPTYDYMHFLFVECLTKLIRRLDSEGVDYDVIYQGGTLVYVGRDRLARIAIEKATRTCYGLIPIWYSMRTCWKP